MNRCYTLSAAAALFALGLASPSAQAQAYQFSTIAQFNGPSTGASPHAGLTLNGNALYGTTTTGGTGGGGTVFSLNTSTSAFSALANFNSGDSTNDPEAGLLLSGTTLYGTTLGILGIDDAHTQGGTVFSVPTSGGSPTTLATFTTNSSGIFPNGANPAAALTLVGTTLYGTTESGDATDGGTVFSLPVAGGTPTARVSFSGGNPVSSLTLVGTTLYGTTQSGGANGVGSIFSFNTVTSAFSTLASFTGGAGGNGTNPAAGLTLVGTTLYGTTEFDGAGSDGTLFSFNTATNAITALVTFTGTANGANPAANLILGTGGILYGDTQNGGANGDGTVFSFNTTTNAFSTLASFSGGAGGATPVGPVTLGANGVIYGTTSGGGNVTDAVNNPLGDGIIFSLTPVAAPEPSPLAVLALGSVGLGVLALRARKRKASA